MRRILASDPMLKALVVVGVGGWLFGFWSGFIASMLIDLIGR